MSDDIVKIRADLAKYADVRSILDNVLDNWNGTPRRLRCANYSNANGMRQRFYRFRKAYARYLEANQHREDYTILIQSNYDTLQFEIEKGSPYITITKAVAGVLLDDDGNEVPIDIKPQEKAQVTRTPISDVLRDEDKFAVPPREDDAPLSLDVRMPLSLDLVPDEDDDETS